MVNPFATDDSIRGELVLPIPPVTAGEDDAGIPQAIASAIEACGKMPEVEKYHRATQQLRAIQDQIENRRVEMGGLLEKRAAAVASQSIGEAMSLGATIRARRIELGELEADAGEIAPIVRALESQARQAATNAIQDRLAAHRSEFARAANTAKEVAMEAMRPLAVAIDELAKTPEALAAFDAQVAALLAADANRLFSRSATAIAKTVLDELNLNAV